MPGIFSKLSFIPASGIPFNSWAKDLVTVWAISTADFIGLFLSRTQTKSFRKSVKTFRPQFQTHNDYPRFASSQARSSRLAVPGNTFDRRKSRGCLMIFRSVSFTRMALFLLGATKGALSIAYVKPDPSGNRTGSICVTSSALKIEPMQMPFEKSLSDFLVTTPVSDSLFVRTLCPSFLEISGNERLTSLHFNNSLFVFTAPAARITFWALITLAN